jgi:hypothetical protein
MLFCFFPKDIFKVSSARAAKMASLGFRMSRVVSITGMALRPQGKIYDRVPIMVAFCCGISASVRL